MFPSHFGTTFFFGTRKYFSFPYQPQPMANPAQNSSATTSLNPPSTTTTTTTAPTAPTPPPQTQRISIAGTNTRISIMSNANNARPSPSHDSQFFAAALLECRSITVLMGLAQRIFQDLTSKEKVKVMRSKNKDISDNS